jgi:hypothetical protein
MAAIRPINSYKDNRGMVVVACCECKRGGNGHRDCGAGWDIKRGDQGCMAGELLDKYDPLQVISWADHVQQEKIKKQRRASR